MFFSIALGRAARSLLLLVGAASVAAPSRPALAASAAPMKSVLFFTKSSAYEHSVIKRQFEQPSHAERVLLQLGPAHGIEFTFSKDGSLFTPEYLAQFDAFFFFTSGDLLAAGRDGNPPMTAAGKTALLEAVRGGKGFIGAHSASDTFHTGETVDTDTSGPRPWRYKNNGPAADPYVRMIGAEFIKHDKQQIAKARVIDPKFPGLGSLGDVLELHEEWYSFADFSPDLHVLLVQQTEGMEGDSYQRPPYPSTWARLHGKGRVFYTGLGHREDVWNNPAFQELLFGGIAWAVGNADADVTPNIRNVTPDAWKLPPIPPPAPAPAAK